MGLPILKKIQEKQKALLDLPSSSRPVVAYSACGYSGLNERLKKVRLKY